MTQHFASSQYLPRSPFDNLGPQTALIAAASPQERIHWVQQLHRAGHSAREASSARGALDLLRKAPIGLLVCAQDLPPDGGHELCRQVREDPSLNHAYVILLADSSLPDSAWERLQRETEDDVDLVLSSNTPARQISAHLREGLRMAGLRRSLSEVRRHVQAELDLVWEIQRKLLPQTVPTPKEFDFTAFYLPSTECGGDYYDLIPLKNGRLAVFIADVSGHGTPAMVTMALARQNVHQNAHQFDTPGELLAELNRLLFDHLPTNQFVTMHCAFIDPATLRCEYSSAGHPAPLHHRRGRGARLLQGCEGYPLKLIMREATYKNHTLQLEPGDTLVYYTDGIPELFNLAGQAYGSERLQAVVEAHAGTQTVNYLESQIVADVMSFSNKPVQDDDITLAILSVK